MLIPSAKLDIITAKTVNITILCDMTSCSLVSIYQCFGGIYYLLHQGGRIFYFEGRGCRFLRNVTKYLWDYAASNSEKPRWKQSIGSPHGLQLLPSGYKDSQRAHWLCGWKPHLHVSDSVYFCFLCLTQISSCRVISTDPATLNFLFKARGRTSGRTWVTLLVTVSINTVSLQEAREYSQQDRGQGK